MAAAQRFIRPTVRINLPFFMSVSVVALKCSTIGDIELQRHTPTDVSDQLAKRLEQECSRDMLVTAST